MDVKRHIRYECTEILRTYSTKKSTLTGGRKERGGPINLSK